MRKSLVRRLLLIVTVVACNSSTEPAADGQYLLQSINDQALPTTVEQQTITSGSLTFNDDGTALITFRVRTDQPFSAYTSSHVWYYTKNGTSVQMLSAVSCPTIMSCDELNGTIEGSNLTLANPRGPVVFRYRESSF